ncbi:hypothetical protein [Streptomyces sp. NPDC093094]|uniref:hypothetical protein n=1 Tax=Streptomyces sp. NPDC093094 TaxID=3366026 RepID=UPI00380C2E21
MLVIESGTVPGAALVGVLAERVAQSGGEVGERPGGGLVPVSGLPQQRDPCRLKFGLGHGAGVGIGLLGPRQLVFGTAHVLDLGELRGFGVAGGAAAHAQCFGGGAPVGVVHVDEGEFLGAQGVAFAYGLAVVVLHQ